MTSAEDRAKDMGHNLMGCVVLHIHVHCQKRLIQQAMGASYIILFLSVNQSPKLFIPKLPLEDFFFLISYPCQPPHQRSILLGKC